MTNQHHDIVVIGGSAGAIEALRTIVANLPADLPAAVLIVIHVPPFSESHLPEIIARSGPLSASHARHHERLERGHIYIAPPDQHMLVHRGEIELSRGPRANHSRPAIDTLFRSAARTYGPRVIGVLLSGALYDGTGGLVSVKDRGGLAIVQDPDEAAVPSMPRSALGLVEADAVLPSSEIGEELVRAVNSPARPAGAVTMSDEEPIGQAIARDIREQAAGERIDQSTVYTCPECGGVLWQTDEAEGGLFHCHIGHVYAPEVLLSQKAEELEAALWTCVRLLRDQATLTRQAATRPFGGGNQGRLRERLDERAQLAERQAQMIRELLESGAIRADSPGEPIRS